MHFFSINPFGKTWSRSRVAEILIKLMSHSRPKHLKEKKSTETKNTGLASKTRETNVCALLLSSFSTRREQCVLRPVFFPG